MSGTKRNYLRLASLAIVACLAMGAAYDMTQTAPKYLQSATLIFYLPKSESTVNAYLVYAPSLIASSEAVSQVLLSPQAQRRIHDAGRPADVDMELVNLYSEQYPNYAEPLATLSAASPDPAAARRAFTAAARLVRHLLAVRQARVSRRRRILVRVIADTGPIAQEGSHTRVFCGLAVLALAGVYAAWGIVDRCLSGQIRVRRRHSSGVAGQLPAGPDYL